MLRKTFGAARWAAPVAVTVFLFSPAANATDDRIVSVGGAITEIIFALGAGDRIAAVDTTSYYPEQANQLPKVGYQRQLSAEGILSMRPDVIVSLDDAGPPRALEQLRDAGARLRLVPDSFSAEGVATKIRIVAEAIGIPDRGAAMADTVSADIAAVLASLQNIAPRRRVLFLLSPSRGAPLASGEGTAADAMIRLAGAENAIKGYQGYKPLSLEIAIAAEPDAILMMNQSVEQIGGRAEVLRLAALAATKAAREGRLISLDGVYLLGFGPRTAHALRDLAAQINPDLILAPLPERAWAKRDTASR